MAFSELEKRKHEKFLEKQYAGVRANIEQTPYGTSLTVPLLFYYIVQLQAWRVHCPTSA